MQSGGWCYAYINDNKTWTAAGATCKALGGYLVEPYTQQENDYLEKIMFEHSPVDIWMGGHDAITEGKWFWATSGRAVSEAFTFWGPGQPNNYHNNQDCMQFQYRSKHWNDEECWKKLPFVCQKPIENTVVG